MKVEEKENKVYHLNSLEFGAFERYLLYLKYHPSPCTNCQKQDGCTGYSLFKKYGPEDRYCSKGREWFEQSTIKRDQLTHAPDDIKLLLERKYLVAFEEKQAGIAAAKLALAQHKLDTYPVKISDRTDFGGRNLWGIKEEDDWSSFDNKNVEGVDE